MQQRIKLVPGLLASALVVLLAACNAPSETGAIGNKPAKGRKPPDPPRIDPQAAQAIHRLSKTLGGLDGFKFVVEARWDEVLPGGLRVEHNTGLRYTVRRPNGLRVEFAGRGDSRLLVYDGTKATLYDRDKKFYAVTSAPDSLDATLDMLANDADILVPLADFLFSDPAKVLLERVTAASFVGIEKVGVTDTEHYVFSQAGLDWQIWIAKGERAFPLRFVLTYLNVDGAPQYTATLSNWDTAPEFQPTDFNVTIPGGAEQVEFTIDVSGG